MNVFVYSLPYRPQRLHGHLHRHGGRHPDPARRRRHRRRRQILARSRIPDRIPGSRDAEPPDRHAWHDDRLVDRPARSSTRRPAR
ncbi:MAG: hypothetical protein MZU95_14270 [Desulfomicrobium escambiense]|nr:hypothetical protein [Desulfomicrobium escambiense]